MAVDKFVKENWAAFEKRYGVLIADDVKVGQQEHIELLDSRKGLPTIRVTSSEGKKVFLHSSVDPVREADKVASCLQAVPGNFIVVYGLGLGYLIEALLEKINEKIPIFVFEPDMALFCMAMKVRDLRRFLSSERVFIIVQGANNSEVGVNFSVFYDLTRYNKMVLTGLSGHQAFYAENYQKTISRLHDVVRTKMINVATLKRLGAAMMSSAIINLPTYYTSPGIRTLFDRFKNVPAIIVSAGPSLNKNIQLLKRAKGKAVILAVGTAVKALQKQGIEPDFMVSIDPEPINYEHFKGINTKHSALITEMQSYPEILENHQGQIFVSGHMPILKWFDGVIEEKGITESGGSVANNAMTAAYKMGANPIVFVGQDLAYNREGHSHATGTIYENTVYTGGENRDYFPVKANDGGELLTDRALYQFLKFFETWIEHYSEPEYINATEGGALIEGTKILTLNEVLEQYCVKTIDVQGIIKEAADSFQVPDFEPLSARVEKRLNDLKDMSKEAHLAIKRLEQLEQACKSGQAKKISRYAKIVKRIYEKFEQDTNIRDVAEWFARSDIQQVLYRTHKADFEDNDDYHDAIADYKIYYEKVINGAEEAQGYIEGCLTQIRGRVKDGCESL